MQSHQYLKVSVYNKVRQKMCKILAQRWERRLIEDEGELNVGICMAEVEYRHVFNMNGMLLLLGQLQEIQ